MVIESECINICVSMDSAAIDSCIEVNSVKKDEWKTHLRRRSGISDNKDGKNSVLTSQWSKSL